MDNIQFGAFVAQLRKEQDMTQKELANKLNVTDKAVSKWETGKGFPDVKLLEPLAQALGVSLVELLQGERSKKESLTMGEAEVVVSQAMDQSQKTTARRYLRLFRWCLTGGAAMAVLTLLPNLYFWYVLTGPTFIPSEAAAVGVIGGADGPTAILTAPTPHFLPYWLKPLILTVLAAVCTILAARIWKLERKLK